MLIPSIIGDATSAVASLSRRVNANSQPVAQAGWFGDKLIKKGEC